EGEQVEFFLIDDHHLAVVADQIVGGAGDCNSAVQKAQLELSQVLLASAIRESNQRIDRYSTFYRVFESLFDLQPVEAENDDLDRDLRPLNGFHQWLDSISRLDQQLHATELLRSLDAEKAEKSEHEGQEGSTARSRSFVLRQPSCPPC